MRKRPVAAVSHSTSRSHRLPPAAVHRPMSRIHWPVNRSEPPDPVRACATRDDHPEFVARHFSLPLPFPLSSPSPPFSLLAPFSELSVCCPASTYSQPFGVCSRYPAMGAATPEIIGLS